MSERSSEVTTSNDGVAEEIANTVIHGVGLVLSIGGLAVLAARSAMYGDVWHIVSAGIYGTTLILLYTTSCLYHGIPHATAKPVLQRLDHAAIFLLIAGTYTPFTLVSLRDSFGWTLFAVVWTGAIVGMALDVLAKKRYTRLSISLHLGLGWVIVIAIKPMLRAVETDGLLLLLAGGLCYSIGVIFYAWKTLKYHHAIWHLFVLTASVLHFFAVLFYVVPSGP